VKKWHLLLLLLCTINAFLGMDLPLSPRDIQQDLLLKREWWYCEHSFTYKSIATVESVAWHPEGKLLAIMYVHSGENKTEIIDAATGSIVEPLTAYIAHKSVAWHPDGKLLAIGGENRENAKIIAFDTDSITHVAVLPFSGSVIGWSSKGRFLAGYWSDGKVGIFNVLTEQTERTFDTNIASIAWNPRKDFLAKRRMDGKVELLNVTTGEENNYMFPFLARSIGWHSNGVYLISGSYDGMVTVSDIITKSVKTCWQMGTTIRSIVCHPYEDSYAIATEGNVKFIKRHEKYTHEQQQLKAALLTWLLIEKPNKQIGTMELLVADIAVKCGWEKQDIWRVWQTFPVLMSDSIFRTVMQRISIHGKDIKKKKHRMSLAIFSKKK
jgi:WD40 repeat protein